MEWQNSVHKNSKETEARNPFLIDAKFELDVGRCRFKVHWQDRFFKEKTNQLMYSHCLSYRFTINGLRSSPRLSVRLIELSFDNVQERIWAKLFVNVSESFLIYNIVNVENFIPILISHFPSILSSTWAIDHRSKCSMTAVTKVCDFYFYLNHSLVTRSPSLFSVMI